MPPALPSAALIRCCSESDKLTMETTTKTKRPWLLPALLAALGVLTALALFAMMPRREADAATMAAANALVETGHADQAIALYEGLVDGGAHDSALYYNLGNARFLAGDAAGAVEAYRQAAALAPNDADIEANLALAEAAAPEMALPPPAAPFGPLAALTGWMTLDTVAVLALVLWLAVFGLWLAWRLTGSRWPRRLLIGAAVALVVVGLSFVARMVMAQQSLVDGLATWLRL